MRTIPSALYDANQRGDLDEYHIRPPYGEGAEIDVEVCADLTCRTCGRVGLDCRQFHNPQTGSYLAYSVCPHCGSQEAI